MEDRSKLLAKTLAEAQAYILPQESLLHAISSLISQGICKQSELFELFEKYYKLYLEGSLPEPNIPEYLKCAITFESFDDPVNTPCGHLFSSAELLKHLLGRQPSCPSCNQAVLPEDLIPNIMVRKQVEDLREEKIAKVKKKLKKVK